MINLNGLMAFIITIGTGFSGHALCYRCWLRCSTGAAHRRGIAGRAGGRRSIARCPADQAVSLTRSDNNWDSGAA